jgi:hypothetical protein
MNMSAVAIVMKNIFLKFVIIYLSG